MTFRSFAVGLLLLVVIVVAITYNDYVYGNTYLSGGNHFPISAVFIIVLFALVLNPLLRLVQPGCRRGEPCVRPSPNEQAPRSEEGEHKVRPYGDESGRGWAFTQAELVVIWCMIAAGIGIPASGLMRYMLPYMVAPFYFPGADSKWVSTFHGIIPSWLVPSKGLKDPVVTLFYESARDKPVDWSAWIVPFFGWGIAIMAAYLMMFCITAIIRKQWVEHERLSFPLAQIPLEITRPPEPGRRINALFRSPAMWLGAAIPIVFWSLAGLNHFYPNVPFINNVNWPVTGLLGSLTGWRGLFIIYFMPVGVSFLLNTEVSLSLWLFFVLNNAQKIIRERMGMPQDQMFESRQQLGGYVAFAAISLWTMRKHLRAVLRKAFAGADDIDDSQEGLSYRTAMIGLIAAIAVLVGWLGVIGCPPHVSLMLLGVIVIALLVLSRFIAQCGLLLVQMSFPPGPLAVVQDLVGDKLIGAKGLTAGTFHQAVLYGDTREVLMPTLLNNARMAESRLNLRSIFIAMMVAVVLSYSVSYVSQVIGYYKYGANSMNPYGTQIYPKTSMDRLAMSIESPVAPAAWRGGGIKHYVIGGGAVVLVSLLRSRFSWWFVHPIGILTAQTYPIQHLWLAIFIGWACKSLAQRYARGPLMAKPRHFFLGIVIGDALVTIFWALIGLALRESIGLRTFPG